MVVDRRDTPRGELVLRRAGEHHEVIANGTFMMDTRDGRSERALVRTVTVDVARGPADVIYVGALAEADGR